MKKLFLILLVLFMAGTAFADNPDLSKLPKGKWLDPAWNATWEIGAESIRILDTAGAVIYDFKDKITDFKVTVALTDITFSFRCDDAARSYVFTKATTDLDMTMEINPDWSADNYKVKMALQK